MHEASIAMSLLEIAEDHCRRYGFGEIQSIRIRIGRASGIMKDALFFSFDIIRSGTLADKAHLIIEEVPVSGRCHDCESTFTTEEPYILSCPACSSLNYAVLGGRELEIVELEME